LPKPPSLADRNRANFKTCPSSLAAGRLCDPTSPPKPLVGHSTDPKGKAELSVLDAVMVGAADVAAAPVSL
jgi:hypothetical protein